MRAALMRRATVICTSVGSQSHAASVATTIVQRIAPDQKAAALLKRPERGQLMAGAPMGGMGNLATRRRSTP